MGIWITLGVAALIAVAVLAFVNQPGFGRLPRGERLERIRRSPNYRDGAFRNLHTTPLLTSGRSRLGTMLGFLFRSSEGIRPEGAVPAVKSDLQNLPRTQNTLVWFGHSSYLLQVDGIRILVDPVFCTASPVGFINKPFEGTDIYTPDDMPEIDYLVITHDHWDHLDHKTVTRLRDRVDRVVCPLGIGEHFERWGFAPEKLIELDWQESVPTEDGLTIHCLPARHFSGRGLRADQTLWASFLFETHSQKLYFGGDGGYDSHFAQIGERFGGIDLAVLENGQYNKDWRYIHTLPEQLDSIARDLRAKNIITVHHSKYALARHPWDEPLANERRMIRDSLLLIVPQIGRIVLLGDE